MKKTGDIFCGGSYVIANNITDYQYKWKVIKLPKYDMYSFLVSANGQNKYGLSKPVYYAPNLYKFIRLGKGNSTLHIPYIHENYIEYGTDDDNVVNKHFNETFRAFYKSNKSGHSSNRNHAEGNGTAVNGNENNQVPVEEMNEGDINKALIDSKRPMVPMSLLIGTVSIIILLTMVLIVLIFVQQKHKALMKGGDSIIIVKDRSNTSYSEGYTQDFDYRSEANVSIVDSVVIRERLKREALAIERKKVLESLSEKKLASGSSNYLTSSSNYVTTKSNSNSEVFSNPTTDFSWQGMEVMAFTPIKVPKDQQKPIQHKPYNGEISLSLKDVDQIDDDEADITQNPPALYNTSLNNKDYCSSVNNDIHYSPLLDDNAVYSPSLNDNDFYSPNLNVSVKKNDPNPTTTINIKE